MLSEPQPQSGSVTQIPMYIIVKNNLQRRYLKTSIYIFRTLLGHQAKPIF